LRFAYQLVIKWIRKAALQIENITHDFQVSKNKITVLEMDELYTYIKKNRIKSEYGLLLMETGVRPVNYGWKNMT
jgi:hypothetical protein